MTSYSEKFINRHPERKYKYISSYAKIFPDFVRVIKYHRPIIMEDFATSSNGVSLANEETDHEKDWLQKSINRTKTKISDLILANNFSHFATFTFDAKNPKIKTEQNRHNFAKMSALLINWLKTEQTNHERTHGEKFKYLIVPERHKNGAWHFHALLENYQNPVENFYSSKNPYITVKEIKTSKRHPNRKYITRYNLGRSELAPIRDKTKMANYIKKYITKELITEQSKKTLLGFSKSQPPRYCRKLHIRNNKNTRTIQNPSPRLSRHFRNSHIFRLLRFHSNRQ